MNWVVGAEVVEYSTPARWVVTQTSTLPEDEQRTGRWPLTEPLGPVNLVHDDGGKSLRFPGDAFRMFKLFGSQHDRGRQMKALTRGRFLVVAPLDWERDAESSGREIQAPEYVVGARHRAHHLEVADDLGGPPAFITPAGRIELPTQSHGFKLEGDRLADAHPEAVALFCGSPPQLRSLRNVTYRTVVVGEEGPRERTHGWRAAAADFEELRRSIAARRAGWFFVRLYDENDDLIDSLDFRFSSRLQALNIQAAGPVPDRDGHRLALVQVLHREGLDVVPKVAVGQDPLPVRMIPGGSCIEIPPSPSYDETNWLIRETRDRTVEVWLRIQRVWWSLLEEGAAPSECRWTDRSLDLRNQDVLATSERVLRIRLPPICWGKDIRIGIEPQGSLRLSPVAGKADEVELPCRKLSRFAELEQGSVYSELKLWIGSEQSNTSACMEGVVATKGLRAEDMQCVQKAQGRDIVLEVNWKEKGKVPVKVLRLWSHSANRNHLIQEQVVPGGAYTAKVEGRHLILGRYLLQLAWRDLRPPTAPSAPREGDPNTLAIQVVPSGDVRTDEVFLIEAIKDGKDGRGTLRKLKFGYSFRILGKIVHLELPSGAETENVLVKAINEGWYCGRLEVEPPSDDEGGFETESDKTNPVKIKCSASEDCVTAIEDRHGDGAMFCSDCGRLYWDAERLKDEESRKHVLYGPIEMFQIRWNP